MKEDRRIRRTKKLLRQALAQLMLEKQIKDITVTDLVERADINRGTFYVHYRDVYDLRSQMEDEIVTALDDMLAQMQHMPSENPLQQLIANAIDYLVENEEIVCSLMRDASNNSLEYKFTQTIEKWRLRMVQAEVLRDQYIARYIGAGLVAVMKKWLSHEDNMRKEELIALLEEMVRPVLAIGTGEK